MARGIHRLAAILQPRSPKRFLVLALLAILAATPNLVQLPAYYAETQKPQWRETIAVIATHQQAGDAIIANAEYTPLSSPRKPLEWYIEVLAVEPAWTVVNDGIAGSSKEAEDWPSSAEGGYQRIWLMLPYSTAESPPVSADTLGDQFRPVQEWEFAQMRLVLFEALASDAAP